jgi:Uncharacterized conserved protein
VILLTNTQNLPAELRENSLFCVWKYEERDGKPTKTPYNPRTGSKAMSNNPDTFTHLADAEAIQSNYEGLGVGVFGNLGAIDIDHCIDNDGNYSDLAADIISIINSYTEISPSGTGIRALCKASNFQYDRSKYYIKHPKLGLEIYIAGCTNKFVTVTGNALAVDMEFGERGVELQRILDKYMLRSMKAPTQVPSRSALIGAVDIEDAELIAKIRRERTEQHSHRYGPAISLVMNLTRKRT